MWYRFGTGLVQDRFGTGLLHLRPWCNNPVCVCVCVFAYDYRHNSPSAGLVSGVDKKL